MTRSFASMHQIRVAVLDDHPLILKALMHGISAENNMTLVGMFSTRTELFTFLSDQQIDALILDYHLADDDMDGILLIKHLRNSFPLLKILVSSTVEIPALVRLMFKAGVRGFIGKSEPHDNLMDAIRTVASGKFYITQKMQLEMDRIAEPVKELQAYVETRKPNYPVDKSELLQQLSPREMEVIRCYLEGMTIAQIAAKFIRSRKTISGQKQAALRKLGLRSDLELFKLKDLI